MRETDLVTLIQKLARHSPAHKQLLEGIGDDCAILQASAKEDWVFTTDFLLENRHFLLTTHSAADVGHKALARSLSDLAAMGAKPLFCLVSLAVPAELASRWLKNFYKGLLALAAEHGVALAGGDLSRFDRVLVDVMCCGRVPHRQALLRSGAKPGDSICVTGELGIPPRRPQPRIKAGLALRRLGVSACMDLSDGLSLDLMRLCQASNVSAELDREPPIARGATLDDALNAGEDYELLFTTSNRVPRRVAGLPVTRIGTMRSGPPLVRLNRPPVKTRRLRPLRKRLIICFDPC